MGYRPGFTVSEEEKKAARNRRSNEKRKEKKLAAQRETYKNTYTKKNLSEAHAHMRTHGG